VAGARGDATAAFQRFTLRQPPLTYVSAADPSGARSTLHIRVDGLLWKEVPSLCGHGPDEHVYVVQTDSNGETSVQFGDGITGARLPTGLENVQAEYRQGMGREALVAAGQIALPLTRPLGVRSVTNPLAASGAQDREGRDQVRGNAPLTVMTLDRLVSLQDYEDFARAFAGIAKALATWTWDGRRRGVFITVAGPDGAAIDPADATFGNLTAALRQAGDPLVPIAVQSYQPAFFQIEAGIKVQADYDPDTVLTEIESALRTGFGFDARIFGQALRRSEVMAAMHQVPGVLALDLDALYRTDADQPELAAELTAAVPQAGTRSPLAAELLTLDPRPVLLRLMP
jgi:predicted phage baseplate assembly protein